MHSSNPTLIEDKVLAQPVIIGDGTWAIFPFPYEKPKCWIILHDGKQFEEKRTLAAAMKVVKQHCARSKSGTRGKSEGKLPL